MATVNRTGAPRSENEGEGNKTADKAYREAATRHVRSGSVEKEAKAAERDVERDPKGYAEAERAGKARSAGDDRASKGAKRTTH